MSTFDEVTIGPCRLIHGNCEAIAPVLGRIGAIITDPPYGHGWKGIDSAAPTRRRWTKRTACHLSGYSTPFDPQPWLTRAKQCIFWGANHFAHLLPPSGGWLVWDKREGTAQNDLSDCELAWGNCGKGARLFRYLWNGLCRAGEIGEHWHPSQKPVALMQWCIEKTSGLVLDPYAGSFSTGIACLRLGRPFIGIELERSYFEVGCRRIEQAYAQLDLTLPQTWQRPTQERLAL